MEDHRNIPTPASNRRLSSGSMSSGSMSSRSTSSGPTTSQPPDGDPSRGGLHVINVSHAFGDQRILSGVSVFVEPGEIVCLLGPSGCGKTTLLRVAAGLERLQVGRISIGNEVVAEGRAGRQLPPEKRGVGLMFQDYALFPHLTVRQNICFGLKPHQSERRAWVQEKLAALGLAQYADKYPHVLSGGQQQRIALLRALAPAPRVLLLDEPFSGLDVAGRAHTREQAVTILKESGIGAMMVTHDPEEAMFMADRILVMDAGRIVQAGTPVDIYFQPETAYVAELFGPNNRFTATVSGGVAPTALGPVPAPGKADGEEVTILIRPDMLELTTRPAPDMARAQVITARPLGRTSHLLLHLEGPGGGQELYARMPNIFLPRAGAVLGVGVAPENVYVFGDDQDD